MVQTWLKDCTENHRDCNQGTPETSWLPTRLIDIGKSQQCIPRLVTSNSIRADASNIRYIALTHRWDSKPLLKLTSQNLQSLEREVPVQSLSAVFSELLQFTKSLGIRFLWIDSLCILQDSKADWQRESLLMSKVYEYAYCNVAATAAADGYNGLFVERDALQHSPFKMTFKWKNYEKAYYCLYSNLWHIGVTTSPLNRRGWVLQERLLSPRTISFNTQLFWECRSLKACEAFPKGLGPNADLESEDVDEAGELCPKSWRRIASETSTRYAPWARIIEQYMVSGLTVASDKLIAVSGIAQAMRSVVNDNYVAGLWERNLLFDLLWYVAPRWNGEGISSFRAPTYQGIGLYFISKTFKLTFTAPSWSWASVEGRVHFAHGHRDLSWGHPLIKIHDIKIVPTAGNLAGQLKSGSITISGVLLELQTLCAIDDDMLAMVPGIGTACCIDDWQDLVYEELLSYVPVRSMRSGNGLELLGLLLRPVPGCCEEYLRVGLLSIKKNEIRGFKWMDSHCIGWMPELQKKECFMKII